MRFLWALVLIVQNFFIVNLFSVEPTFNKLPLAAVIYTQVMQRATKKQMSDYDPLTENLTTVRAPRPLPSSVTGAASPYPATSQLVEAAIANALNNALSNLRTYPLITRDVTVNGTLILDSLSGVLKATNGTVNAGQVATANIENGAIITAKIEDLAVTADKLAGSIPDTKLNTIVTVGKVLNDATTADSTNTAFHIVARDSAGSFQSQSITLDDTIKAPTTDTQTLTNSQGSVIAINKAINLTDNFTVTGDTTLDTALTGFLKANNGVVSAQTQVQAGEIADNAVDTDAIANGNVTNAKLASDIDASKITAGTLANARTTATSSNTADTIVLRGASGEFSAGTISANLSGGSGSFTTLSSTGTTTLNSSGSNDTQIGNASSHVGIGGTANASYALAVTGNTRLDTGLTGALISNSGIVSTVAYGSSDAANALVQRGASGEFSSGTITTTKVTGLSSPATATDATNKAYVDTVSVGLMVKTPVFVVSVRTYVISENPV